MKNTKRILITITFAGISFLSAGEVIINDDKETPLTKENSVNSVNKNINANSEARDKNIREATDNIIHDQKARISGRDYTSKRPKHAYIKTSKYNNRHKIKEAIVLNTLKLKYINKVNQIEQCVLISESITDLKICNQRIHNLSRNIDKITNRANKVRNKNKKKFNRY